ncbi:MAG: xylose isomerase [Thermoanaerobacter sp.]|jgi:sugar phosphate isomerase/epimerase|nr:xylose isomerase [Thermoanaerobacter sp.]
MRNKIKFGMPTLIEKPKINECVALCKGLGLDFIEINMNLPHYQIGNIDADEILKLSIDNDIFLTIHLDENLNVCDFNESVANAYLNTVLQTIDHAKKLNIPILNMHMATGVYFTLPDRKIYLFDEYKDHYFDKLKQFRDVCTKAIGDSSIKICIENSDGYRNFMREGVKILLESDVFALTWDIGHDHGSKSVDTEFILENANRVIHMHIHDALGIKNHLVLGSGEINLAEKINFAREHHCSCVIETKTIDGLKKSVNFLKEHILFDF